MTQSVNLGFPRIGAKRELKKALESYWQGRISAEQLWQQAADLRQRHWQLQDAAGIDHIPSNDFSLYDHVLDTTALLGNVPSRFNWSGATVDLDTYFAIARGNDTAHASDMTKWFDTNYHYIVPEFEEGRNFGLSSTKIFDEFLESRKRGIKTRPVILGPITYLLLGKAKGNVNIPDLLPRILPIYEHVLRKLKTLGADWVQIDEPALVLDLPQWARDAYKPTYESLASVAPKIFLATYFGSLGDNTDLALSLPASAIHIDLVRAPEQYLRVRDALPADRSLSLGLVDGRNIWKTDLARAHEVVADAEKKLGSDRVLVGPSCSLLHSPVDLDNETELDPEIKSWLAFATQKLGEVTQLQDASLDGDFRYSNEVVQSRHTSPRIHADAVKARVAAITPDLLDRQSPFQKRAAIQHSILNQPLFPTTTIGSFPQTAEIRQARADFRKGAIGAAAYESAMKQEIKTVVDFQESIDLDVLVHGEPERNDMVEYFGEQLSGFAFTQGGWVQSYGSRCVKPPIIYGDVARPRPMTVGWSTYAQSLTQRPMKGMLTGPVTILQWSFVRDDQPRSVTCNQIALALRDEVRDLEAAGITTIQMDEPAIREGLPLRKKDWDAYLEWSVNAFRLSVAGAADSTQIHTHMCYSEFNDMIEAIGNMDADVISIESSRSDADLLQAFNTYKYPNEIGPGVYDIHSPRIPDTGDMVKLLEQALIHIPAAQLWVNPDCGLKTRGWDEVRTSLQHMVSAARILRTREDGRTARRFAKPNVSL